RGRGLHRRAWAASVAIAVAVAGAVVLVVVGCSAARAAPPLARACGGPRSRLSICIRAMRCYVCERWPRRFLLWSSSSSSSSPVVRRGRVVRRRCLRA
ncbi:hypothetical protein DFJ73DRAFT_838848, partial [Zopfochytrium polystomum]